MAKSSYPSTATIRVGRAYVRLIEACAVLIELEENDEARADLERLRRRYQDALRALVAVLPAHVTAEIMAASEKLAGLPVGDVGEN